MHRLTKYLTVAFAGAAMLGCVGTSPTALRTEGVITVLDTALSPEDAYRKVVEGSRTCYDAAFEIASDYFPVAQTGRLSVTVRATIGVGTFYAVDTSPSDKGTTLRIASNSGVTAIPGNVAKWLTGDYSACKLR